MEQVLVVKSALLAPYLTESFISGNTEELLRIVHENYEFINRSDAEENLNYKQIIPYIFIKCASNILLLRRRKAQTEKRLHGLLSLGVGGHINPADGDTPEDVIMRGLMRELHEEVDVKSILFMRFRGIINDKSSEVSNYHLGLCYELETDAEVAILETEKMEGKFVPVSSLPELKDEMETWSQLLLEAGVI